MAITDAQEVSGDAPVALYRLYDGDERLLYVGITNNPAARFAEHAKEHSWWPEVTRKALAWCDGREEALEVEAAAQRAEMPRHCHNFGERSLLPKRVSRGTPVRYFRVSDALWDAAKARAGSEFRTMTDVIMEGLRDYANPHGGHSDPCLNGCHDEQV